jgi:hypothetical protein
MLLDNRLIDKWFLVGEKIELITFLKRGQGRWLSYTRTVGARALQCV